LQQKKLKILLSISTLVHISYSSSFQIYVSSLTLLPAALLLVHLAATSRPAPSPPTLPRPFIGLRRIGKERSFPKLRGNDGSHPTRTIPLLTLIDQLHCHQQGEVEYCRGSRSRFNSSGFKRLEFRFRGLHCLHLLSQFTNIRHLDVSK
jgi:hypothetical protein